MTPRNSHLVQVLAAFVAGQAVSWFLGDGFSTHSALRVAMVARIFRTFSGLFEVARHRFGPRLA